MKIIVIGNGMVGHNFIEKLVESECSDKVEIITFSEEPYLAYDRVYLSSYFSGSSADDLSLVKGNFYQDNNIKVYLNDKVISINRDDKSVISANGEIIFYDTLIIATGSYPFVPPIQGNDRKNCFVYRTLQDLDNIREASKQAKVGVVIGGGLLGLEAAKALKDLDLDTHVIEFAPRLMPIQLDDGGAGLLARKIENLNVHVHTKKTTLKITDGENHFHKMHFKDEEDLETDLIVFSAGIRPRDELAKNAGLKIGLRGGVEVDNFCLTSDKNIYAIGECALYDGTIFGLVAPGYAMAKVVVDNINNIKREFTGYDMSAKLKLMGVDVGSIGDPHGNDENALSYIYENGSKEIYKKLVVSMDNKRLLGAVLVGDTDDYGNLLQLMLNEIPLPKNPESLILPNIDGSSAMGVSSLPDSAQICSCYDVSKGDINSVVDDGGLTMSDIKQCTKATTGCGGCAVLVKDVLNDALQSKGVEVNNNICEHFEYTRADLFNFVKIESITTFNDLIIKHGKGKGCDICKPAIASILGSIYNDSAIKKENIPLADTNDKFLANMQKDGTYSIIPRVPGGEITPDKLIALGSIAKEYGLYTKVNGGQRIVLFGASMNDLPTIWEKLLNAGFESGQAYAKSLRTVKSCIGSTWCRYGIDDSVSLAIELENRYKGLRSPHKIKMGVSGCTRECAEARSKDIGVISTENGWNLYICGNGGMQPRHADLFASDLDKKTLIQYIDRILMFYIKTADRLQRTARWLENLDGGMDYLKEVVIDDRLDLNNEFEKQMEFIVASYKCDWRDVIENKSKLKHFKQFVNIDIVDPEQTFIKERGQFRPANQDEKNLATSSRV